MKIKNNYKIIIHGSAGNGVRLMSQLLIQKLNEKYPNAYITYFFDYDSTVRTGKTTAYISFNRKKKIHEFIFFECDLLLTFKNLNTKRFKAEESIGSLNRRKSIKIDFEGESLKTFNTQLYANTIALGYLSAKLGLSKSNILFDEKNRKAFKIGYGMYK